MTLAGLVSAAPAAAEPVPLTVEIFHVLQLENPDGDGSDGDFFVVVTIDNGPEIVGPRVEDDDFATDWKFTRTIENSPGRLVPVKIRLVDFDSFAAGDDDQIDISPRHNDLELNLIFGTDSQTWAGDDITGGTAEGDGDHDFPEVNDGRKARILFDISTVGSTDVDGDGIPNTVERQGLALHDGTRAFPDPCRKTILMQLDYMTGAADGHSHQPKQAARDEVIAAFNAAPVGAINPCPFGGGNRAGGIQFIFLPGKSVNERPVMGFDDNYRAARDANFDPDLRPYAHYGIFVHDQKAGSSSSGLCCEKTQGEKDLLVSLGSWRNTCIAAGANGTLQTAAAGDDVVSGMSIGVGPNRNCNTAKAGDDVQVLTVGTGAADAFVGTTRDQSGTIMHELGHSLGLGHGGNDPTNNKPNYLSVMNYSFDPGGVDIDGAGGTRLDYSGVDLPDLDKSKLSETAGIQDGTDFTHWTHPGGDHFGRGNGPLNWSGNKNPDGTDIIDPGTVAVDINAGDDVCILPGGNGEIDTDPEGDDSKVGGARPAILSGGDGVCQTTDDDDDDTGPATVLTGYDDWRNLQFRAIVAVVGAGVAADHGADIEFPIVLQREITRDAFFDPDLVPTKTVDKADAEPGDALAYAVKVDNIGTGTATVVKLTDTFPDSSTTTRTLADIAAGKSRTENFSYTIPCATEDGTLLTNGASVAATDLGNSPESNTANNTSSVGTRVHAPKLTLAKTANATTLAGEAVTTRLTIGNVGTGSATNVALDRHAAGGCVLQQSARRRRRSEARDGREERGRHHDAFVVAREPCGWFVHDCRVHVAHELARAWRHEPHQPCIGVIQERGRMRVRTRACDGDDDRDRDAPDEEPAVRRILADTRGSSHRRAARRIQATDQRYDGSDGTVPDGKLSNSEAQRAISASGSQPGQLARQELAVLFDLASRRINASTLLNGKLAVRLGAPNVRGAVLYGIATLALPVSSATKDRYSDATTLLDNVANNKIEVY